MTEPITPTRAYDLLEPLERQAVDNYVRFAVAEQDRKRERIIHALHLPIPSEYIRRSKNALYRPLVRAAVAERIREEANKQDISPDRVIEQYAAIATADIGDYVDDVGFGELKIKRIEDIPPIKRAAIKSIDSKPGAFGLHTKVVLHDKIPALKAMAEMMGLVAPDKPPALLDYVRPLDAVEDARENVPEKAYAALLEQLTPVKS